MDALVRLRADEPLRERTRITTLISAGLAPDSGAAAYGRDTSLNTANHAVRAEATVNCQDDGSNNIMSMQVLLDMLGILLWIRSRYGSGGARSAESIILIRLRRSWERRNDNFYTVQEEPVCQRK